MGLQFDDGSNGYGIVCVDGSYMTYAMLHSAVKSWKEESIHAEDLPDMKLEPNASPIDVLVYQDFRDILRKKVGDFFFNLRSMIRDKVFNGLPAPSGSKVFFVMDSHSGNWRYQIYREYKGNRKAQLHPFDVRRVFDYIVKTMIPESGILDEYGWKKIECQGIEGDDIIATLMMNSDAETKGIVSSDHDFLQLGAGVHIFDLQGKEILPDEYNGKRITHKDATMMKLLVGDTSDNIPHVFHRLGPKTALKKYIIGVDKSVLKGDLANDPIADKQFKTNAKLILFKEIPKDVTESIKSEILKVDPEFKLICG